VKIKVLHFTLRAVAGSATSIDLNEHRP